jgi:hypothetical protein
MVDTGSVILGSLNPGIRAALEVGSQLGFGSIDPILLQETNHTVVWLSPHPVVAKVATRASAAEKVIREHQVATSICDFGAPIGRPLKDVSPQTHQDTGFTVTLWERLERSNSNPLADGEAELSLRQVHDALQQSGVVLPGYERWPIEARAALADDVRVAAVSTDDLGILRGVFDVLLAELEHRPLKRQPLHGEPHEGNRILTDTGLRWIDFENVCTGPLEWDLVFLGENERAAFGEVDSELMSLLSVLISASVATWCLGSTFPAMVEHAHPHLAKVKDYWSHIQ